MTRMIKQARAELSEQAAWVSARRSHIDQSLARLNMDFRKLALIQPQKP